MRFFLFCLFFFSFFATDRVIAQQQYFRFDRLTTHEGLPSNNTECIIQDKQGLIWIGTSEGLCRYDGYHITTFKYNPTQPHSLVSNYIYALSEDEDGNIWIATAGGWCELLFNTQTFLNANDFKNFSGKTPRFFTQYIQADHHHHVFLGGYTGSCRINLEDSAFEPLHFSPKDTLTPSGVNCIYQDKEGLVWFTFQNCDRVYDPVKDEFYSPLNNPYNYPLVKNNGALLRQGNTLWMSQWGKGLYAFDLVHHGMHTVGKDTAGLKELATDVQPKKMIADLAGNLWVLMEDKGIYYMDFKHNNFQLITNQRDDLNSLPSIALNGIIMDRSGNIWIATDKGVARWNNQPENFQLLPYTSRIPSSFNLYSQDNFEVDAIIENDSDIWIAASPAGVMVVSKNNTAACRHIQIKKNRLSGMNRLINHLLQDRDGNTWVSTQEGYAKYDPLHDCLTPYLLERHDISGNSNYQVSMMMQDRNGLIWIASKKGLGKLNPQTNTTSWISLPVTHTTGVPFFIRKVLVQNDSTLWLLSDGGVFSLNKNTNQFVRYDSENKGEAWKAFDDCSDALFISDTLMMISSQFGGLIQLNPKTNHFKIYTTNDGLLSNNVRCLYADAFGAVWITTMNGLSRLNLKTGTFSRYDFSNGLKDLLFLNSNNFYPEKDGNVLLLDAGYILRFNPAQFAHTTERPKVSFTSFEKYDEPAFYEQPINLMKHISLKYTDRYFTIRFSTLDFNNTSRTQYAYKLDGFDKRWHTTNTPYVSYSNLSGGTYTLHVKASLDGNLWGSEKILAIAITPPFWKTWWFYASCVLLISILVFSFYRMRINQLKHELFLRSKISRDLHDDVGSTLSSLGMVSALARKKITEDPARTKELLEKITESSERMTGNMQDIVWAVNPLNDSFSEIIARMQKFASQILELKSIELFFEAEEKIKSLKLPLEYRGDLFLIFKEAINNVAKYSNARHAWIGLHKNYKSFFLEIRDDGKGFIKGEVEEGNGLRNMQARAKNLNGKLMILSEPNKGTTVTLEFTP